jgi:glycosyltransferase involved in cell wall biosynthesis
VEDLAQAMGQWSRKPALPDEKRWEMHKRVAEQFSLERAARDLSELYHSI